LAIRARTVGGECSPRSASSLPSAKENRWGRIGDEWHHGNPMEECSKSALLRRSMRVRFNALSLLCPPVQCAFAFQTHVLSTNMVGYHIALAQASKISKKQEGYSFVRSSLTLLRHLCSNAQPYSWSLLFSTRVLVSDLRYLNYHGNSSLQV
jgi:hypothetical protein